MNENRGGDGPIFGSRTALFTTVYPGVEKYLSGWRESVEAQADQEFDLFIAVDAMAQEDVVAAMGLEKGETWVFSEPGDTPASLRNRAIEAMSERYDAVVFVDADDILEPTRVQAAKAALDNSDVNGCAMSIIDEVGARVGCVPFRLPGGFAADPNCLARLNVFGLTNSAYRTTTLRAALPVPTNCVAVDWFLAASAWLQDAMITFDENIHMRYRQYGGNTASVIPPFTEDQVLKATDRKLSHYALLQERFELADGDKWSLVAAEMKRTEAFNHRIAHSTDELRRVTLVLNSMSSLYLWWEQVAHPGLNALEREAAK